jgi:hypothetical protein
VPHGGLKISVLPTKWNKVSILSNEDVWIEDLWASSKPSYFLRCQESHLIDQSELNDLVCDLKCHSKKLSCGIEATTVELTGWRQKRFPYLESKIINFWQFTISHVRFMCLT